MKINTRKLCRIRALVAVMLRFQGLSYEEIGHIFKTTKEQARAITAKGRRATGRAIEEML